MTGIENLKIPDQSGGDITKSRKPKPAILPMFCNSVNTPFTKLLIEELKSSTSEKRLSLAVDTYEQLYALTKSNSDLWTLNLLQASQKSPKERRDYLIKQDIFNGGNYLFKPEAVKPGMEITNLDPDAVPYHLKDSVALLKNIFYQEYTAVKNNLRIPVKGSPFHLNTSSSLLIDDYSKAVIREAKKVNGSPLIAVFGPGAGEELIRLTSCGFSVVTFDYQSAKTSEHLFRETYRLSGKKCPEIVNLETNNGVDTSKLDRWEQKDNQEQTIFICPNTDFSKKDCIPDNLHKRVRLSASVYTMHEMKNKDIFLENVASTAKGGVVIVDGLPTPEALDNVILPVSQRSKLFVAGSQAIISYLLCDPPNVVNNNLKQCVKEMDWEVDIMPTPPPPLCYPLELIAIGKNKKF